MLNTMQLMSSLPIYSLKFPSNALYLLIMTSNITSLVLVDVTKIIDETFGHNY